MLLADPALALRIERTVTTLLVEFAAASAARRPELAARAWSLGGGAAALAGPTSPFNKVGGIGLEAGVGPEMGVLEEVLAEVEAEATRRGAMFQVELASLATPEVHTTLARRGYTVTGCEHVLARALTPSEEFPAVAGITVELDAADTFDTWLDVVLSGFANPDVVVAGPPEEFPRDVIAADLADMHAVTGFTRWSAYRAGVRAGGASLRVSDGVAQLYGAATLRDHRRRGGQTALLHARLAAAARAGADLATVTTQPGSKSQANAERQGFALVYARTIWRLGAT